MHSSVNFVASSNQVHPVSRRLLLMWFCFASQPRIWVHLLLTVGRCRMSARRRGHNRSGQLGQGGPAASANLSPVTFSTHKKLAECTKRWTCTPIGWQKKRSCDAQRCSEVSGDVNTMQDGSVQYVVVSRNPWQRNNVGSCMHLWPAPCRAFHNTQVNKTGILPDVYIMNPTDCEQLTQGTPLSAFTPLGQSPSSLTR